MQNDLSTRVTTLPLVLLVFLTPSLSEALQHVNQGVELEQHGRMAEAVAEYDEAIRLDPQLAVAYNNRGAAYVELGQPERGTHDLDEAIRLNPGFAVAFANRARGHAVLGDDAAARQDADRAIGLGFDRAPLEEELERLQAKR